MFALDPVSIRVLGAAGHISTENMIDKVDLVTKVLHMFEVNADLLIHGDCCHLEKYIKKRGIRFRMYQILCGRRVPCPELQM